MRNVTSRYHPQDRPEFYRYPVDFFARRPHFIDHLAPTWLKMPANMKGYFYVPECLLDHAKSWGIDAIGLVTENPRNPILVSPKGKGPVVTSAYGDLQRAWERCMIRPQILMEHGVGLTFNHAGYAGGTGLRARVALFLAPNEYIRRKTSRTFPTAPQVVIGTPKLDEWAKHPTKKPDEPPTVAIAFHWDGSAVAPEAGNAWQHYYKTIPELKTKYTVIGHGHPKIIDKLAPVYEQMGIEVVRDFRDVMERADLYINDCSSTMYEFCVTGRPVVVLNAPWFRRDVKFGIRFWDFSDVGINVEEPEQLMDCVAAALEDRQELAEKRKTVVQQLYPNLGYAAQIAADAITAFVEGMKNGKK